jgi:hypothetical protein
MLAELLPTPAEFFDYATLRVGLPAAGITVYVETDALAQYLKDRFREVLGAVQGEVLIGYSSGQINDFYTLTPFGIDVPRPTTGVPVAVLTALTRSLTDSPESWPALAKAVMRQSRTAWGRWAKRARRKKGTQMSWFDFSDPRLRILSGRGTDSDKNATEEPNVPTLAL